MIIDAPDGALLAFFGGGRISVSVRNCAAGVRVDLGDLPQPHEAGAILAKEEVGPARMTLIFSEVAALDVVLHQLGKAREHLAKKRATNRPEGEGTDA